ncbi:MAG: histidinol-phosphatase HisJ family protein [Mogibacterium sp.]|nr:histidinol-phosphatase HisJ family protein [Mogibacterium sp.]
MYDLHMHTTYCDGKNTAEEMVLAAIDKGLDTVGISGHSFTPHDTSYCMSREGSESYNRELRELADKYAGRIRVLTGIERDYYADISIEAYDYVIGSLHYLFYDGCWTDVDDNPQKLMDFADRHFDGDMMCLAELYYKTLENIVSRTDCDIIGHFDLITKFNEIYRITEEGKIADLRDQTGDTACPGLKRLFDISDPRYTASWKKAVDRIFAETAGRANRLEALGLFTAGDKPVFEINTGAISRGYRTVPYPAQDQIDYIKSKGGILILNSDSHSIDSVCCGFDEFSKLL